MAKYKEPNPLVTFSFQYKLVHIWLAVDIVLLILFQAARENRAGMNTLAEHVTSPLKETLGALNDRFSFSMMEVLYTLAALLLIAYIAVCVFDAVCLPWYWEEWGKVGRSKRIWRSVVGLVDIVFTAYLGFCLLWGVNFYTDSFQELSGIQPEFEISREKLQSVTQYFADRLTEAADSVPRDENGLFAASLDDIFAAAPEIYRAAEEEFPFLAFQDRTPKRMFYSKLMSIMGYTGVYCPFTGESNLNVDIPACQIPNTIAHELAHQRGIASEGECNFLAVLASTTSGNPLYVYSGWMMGYTHLGNLLAAVDQDAQTAVWEGLPDSVKADIENNNNYWEAYRGGLIHVASNKIYDTFLKSYGVSGGTRSYGSDVAFFVAYYGE